MAMTAPSEHKRVPLTQFHNATGDFLDQAMREPIVLTSHGRPRQIVADHAYVARLEAIARGKIIEALDIEAHLSADMPEALRARILANLPSAEEIANGRWNDED